MNLLVSVDVVDGLWVNWIWIIVLVWCVFLGNLLILVEWLICLFWLNVEWWLVFDYICVIVVFGGFVW